MLCPKNFARCRGCAVDAATTRAVIARMQAHKMSGVKKVRGSRGATGSAGAGPPLLQSNWQR